MEFRKLATYFPRRVGNTTHARCCCEHLVHGLPVCETSHLILLDAQLLHARGARERILVVEVVARFVPVTLEVVADVAVEVTVTVLVGLYVNIIEYSISPQKCGVRIYAKVWLYGERVSQVGKLKAPFLGSMSLFIHFFVFRILSNTKISFGSCSLVVNISIDEHIAVQNNILLISLFNVKK